MHERAIPQGILAVALEAVRGVGPGPAPTLDPDLRHRGP